MRRITRPPSTNERRGLTGGRVANTNPMMIQERGWKLPQREVLERQGLLAGRERPAAHRALERHAHVMPDVAVRIADELERGRRVHADQPPHRDGQSGLLAHLPHARLVHRLADLDRAAGQPPLAAVGALLEEKTAAAIEDDGRDGGANSEGAGSVTLERDHPFTLPDAVALRNILPHAPGAPPTPTGLPNQPPAALKSRWNCFHAIGAVAPMVAFSSTCAAVFMPTSAVPTPGVERTNWSARCASVVSPGMYSAMTGGKRMSCPWWSEAEAITEMSSARAASSTGTTRSFTR